MQLEQLLQFINKYMPIFEVISFYNSTRGGKIKGGGKKKAITLYLCLLACLCWGCLLVCCLGFFQKKI